MNREQVHTAFLGLRIPPIVKDRLIRVAANRHLSVSQLVRLMIEDKLRREIKMQNGTG